MSVSPPSRRTTGSWLVGLYPASWRARYGDEMCALLEARPPGPRARVDLLRGAWDAHAQASAASRLGATAAFTAGAAWTVAGAATIVQPTPPDWPGYLVATLPIGLVAALAGLAFTLPIGGRLGDGHGRTGAIALAAYAVGQIALLAALVMAVLGGPYGPITGAGHSVAAIGVATGGLALLRVDSQAIGGLLIVVAAALAVPTAAAWIVAGGAWTAIGVWWVMLRPRLDDHDRLPPLWRAGG
jgi:hypothetical protein